MGKLLERLKFGTGVSKGERLIYVVVLLWVLFGVLGILRSANLTQVAGYYASLTLFVSTYLWGEWKRSSISTPLFTKGENSSREVIIYITVFLWTLAGVFGVFYLTDLNPLTVYFSALSPFVMSYIIYKTTKGETTTPLPMFDGTTQALVDNAKNAVDIKQSTVIKEEIKREDNKTTKTTTIDTLGTESQNEPLIILDEPKDRTVSTTPPPIDDSKDVTDGI